MVTGVERFVDDMTKAGFAPQVEGEVVTFQVTPVDGVRAGCPVGSGVSTEELDPWPQAPPHWIHLPADVTLTRTNCQNSPKQEWLMHSRNLSGWGDAPPAVSWASHVRAVLSEATS